MLNRIRFGLCCLFCKAPIKFRTTTASYLAKLHTKKQSTLQFLQEIILSNLDNLMAAIIYCMEHQIGSFRIGSQFLPLFTHPTFGYQICDLPYAQAIIDKFAQCKSLAEKYHIRLTFHPDQFVVLNSIYANVVTQSIAELEYHGIMGELLCADVINIHAGGVYGNKTQALIKFVNHFEALSDRVRSRLTIENDDRCFTVKDLLPICQQLKIPLVYDVHHHRCLPDGMSIEEASQLAYSTWNREPLFHISSPKEGWQGPHIKRHHDYINPKDFPLCWLNFPTLTIDIEAKAKELAILRLQQDRCTKI